MSPQLLVAATHTRPSPWETGVTHWIPMLRHRWCIGSCSWGGTSSGGCPPIPLHPQDQVGQLPTEAPLFVCHSFQLRVGQGGGKLKVRVGKHPQVDPDPRILASFSPWGSTDLGCVLSPSWPQGHFIQRQRFVPTHCRVGVKLACVGSNPGPGHVLAVWSWASCLPSLYLRFLFWKRGLVTVPA